MVQFTLKKPYETKSSVMTAISKYQLERWSKQFSDLDLQIFLRPIKVNPASPMCETNGCPF
jgi:hypothetical protein